LDSLTLPLRLRSQSYLHYVALVESQASIPSWLKSILTLKDYLLVLLKPLRLPHLL
jgi:hypothetical protein